MCRFEGWLLTERLDPLDVTPLHASRYFNIVLASDPPRVLGRWGTNHPTALSPASRKRSLVAVKAAYEYAFDIGLIDVRNPCKRVFVKLASSADRQFFTGEELTRISRRCRNERDRLIVLLLALTGIRLHELCELRWELWRARDRSGTFVEQSWVDLGDRALRVLGKGERFRVIPVHPTLYPALVAEYNRQRSSHVIPSYRTGGGLTPSGLLDGLNPLLCSAGVKQPGSAAHSFRRTLNDSLLVNARGYDYERRLILGHSHGGDVNAVSYLRPTLERLRDLVEKAYLDDPTLRAELGGVGTDPNAGSGSA